ncbi:hypothetical protein FACS189499_07040 [Clostridia bacterium]|nr:hypothetical protein FACS189499_07040 [Clostridia bacterium]
MPLSPNSDAANRVFHMAHRFLNEFRIKWLPVCYADIIHAKQGWHLKYVHDVAYEIGKSERYVLDHVMRSNDGLAMYDPKTNQYDIILNSGDDIPQTRMRWTAIHEIDHIYLGHLDNERTRITSDLMSREEYEQFEFEADIFAGEVLASKWIMRQIDIVDENDIAAICGISDDAALSRYRKATEDYSYTPVNAVLTIKNFEDYLKNVAICRDLDNMDEFARFAFANRTTQKLPKPKHPALRKPGSCPYCGNERGLSATSNFCIACGSALKSGLMVSERCECVNHETAAYCEECGNRVYRIKQGFVLEEFEIQ